MSKILIVLATVPTATPAGQSFSGQFLFKVDGVAAIESQTQHTTADMADGDHTVTCQALDSNNGMLGAEVSGTFTLAGGQIVIPGAPVPAPPPVDNTYPAPASLSFTVVA